MRRSDHTDDEIMTLLMDAERGTPIEDICRTAHISVRTYYRWRERLGSMTPKSIRRLRELELENRFLKQMLARSARGFDKDPFMNLDRIKRENGIDFPADKNTTRIPGAYRNCRTK